MYKYIGRNNQNHKMTTDEIFNYYIAYSQFRSIVSSRNYVYTDKMLVLIMPEYIVYKNGTTKAKVPNSKIDDLCVKVIPKFPQTSQRGGGMNPICGAPRSRDIINHEFREASQLSLLNTLNNDNYHSFLGLEKNIKYDIPYNFNKALVYLMQKKKITVSKLANETGLSDKTIQRLRTSDMPHSIETVIILCVGLHLGVFTSQILIELAGYKLLDTELHHAYYCCILCSPQCTVEECNYFLLRLGFKPLNNLYDEQVNSPFIKLGYRRN